MWLLFVVYAALSDVPEEWIQSVGEFPLSTLEECTEKAEALAIDSMTKTPELANYKFYLCTKESI